MSLSTLMMTLVIGALAGWLAGQIMRGSGLGLAGNIVVGVLGAFVGGWLFGVLGVRLGSGIAAALMRGVSGSVLLLFLVGLLKRA